MEFSPLKQLACAFVLCLAQFAPAAAQDGSEAVQAKPKQVLVVPFQPSMYYCNNDQFICQASHMNGGDLMKTIRASVTAQLVGSLSQSFASNGANENKPEDGLSDVERLYQMSKYTKENKPLVAYYKSYEEKGLSSFLGKSEKSNAPEFYNPKKPNMKSHHYFRAEFVKPDLLAQISAENNVQHYLFIDHFEMETHFKDCTDMQKQVSMRDVYVHYTLLDASGKFIDGGVVCTTFQSKSNDIKEIMKATLPGISNMIVTQIKPIIGA